MKGWRTLTVSIIIAAIGAVEAFDWASIIPENFQGLFLIVLGMVIAYLRKITNTKIGKKTPGPNISKPIVGGGGQK